MPITGALVDYTPYRRAVGIVSGVLIVTIQAIQIYTVSSTWFPMAILQALAGFVLQVQLLATFAYFPSLATQVGQKTMANFTAKFQMIGFAAQAAFLIVVVVLSTAFEWDDVFTAHISQAINVVWVGGAFYVGWKLLPSAAARHTLPEHRSLLTAGFVQIWQTTKKINRHYGRGLRWFLLAVVFADAGANAFTVVSVPFLSVLIQMDGAEVGYLFLIVLVLSIPGAKVGEMVTDRTNPNLSLKLCMTCFSVWTVLGAIVLNGPDRKYATYGFCVVWGILLGWFYPTETLFFSMSLPKGSEAELSGFFVYCTQIMAWLPPLIFTLMNESGISMRWGLMSLVIFFFLAIAILHLIPSWDVVLEEAAKDTNFVEVDNEPGQDDDDVTAATAPTMSNT